MWFVLFAILSAFGDLVRDPFDAMSKQSAMEHRIYMSLCVMCVVILEKSNSEEKSGN